MSLHNPSPTTRYLLFLLLCSQKGVGAGEAVRMELTSSSPRVQTRSGTGVPRASSSPRTTGPEAGALEEALAGGETAGMVAP
eukprot:scaffold36091_cov20-Tisochrysis_lutea.AAC.1